MHDEPLSSRASRWDHACFWDRVVRPSDRLTEALCESGAEVVTVAVRRVEHAPHGLYEAIEAAGARVLPNTAGCFTAREAVATARLAREAFETTG